MRRTPPPAPPLPEAPTAKIADPVAPPGEEDKAAAPPLIAATAVKKGAVIYSTPRPPTPEKPKPVEAMAPHGPVVVPVPENHNLNEIFNPTTTITEPPPPQPVTYMDALVSLEKSMNPAGFPESANVEKPKRKQYFHDGEAWVYAFEQPPMKKKAEPVVLEDVVKKAILTNVLENMEKGKYNVTPQFKDNGRRKKNKPEVRKLNLLKTTQAFLAILLLQRQKISPCLVSSASPRIAEDSHRGELKHRNLLDS